MQNHFFHDQIWTKYLSLAALGSAHKQTEKQEQTRNKKPIFLYILLDMLSLLVKGQVLF